MRILALDLSTSTGWSIIDAGILKEYGHLSVSVNDFNVNNHPEKSPHYPYNIIDAVNSMADQVLAVYKQVKPDLTAIENTVRGRNRSTQRILEFLHKEVLELLRDENAKLVYLDPSEWRAALEVRLSKDDKKNNRMVYQGKKRGKVTKKHLSVRMANALCGLDLILKHNDIADSICLGLAAHKIYAVGK